LIDAAGFAQIDISRTGILITAPYDSAVGDMMLTWLYREGRGEPLRVPHQPFNFLALSPDESRAVLSAGNSIEVLDFSRPSMTKLTLPARAENPAWSRDGRRIYFGLEKEKFYQIFSKAADDSGAVALAFPSGSEEDPLQTSADGSRLLYYRTLADGLNELRVRSMVNSSAQDASKLLFKSLFFDSTNAGFSPDGRWVVYQSE